MSAQPRPAPLVPINQATVQIRGDTLLAVLVDAGDGPRTYVPLRPLCDALGLDWSAQTRRIRRDDVLADVVRFVAITPTNPSKGGNPNQLALPIEFAHGFLFGVTASRVKPEHREKLTAFRREAFGILWDAFGQPSAEAPKQLPAPSDSALALASVRATGLAIAELAGQQMALEARTTTAEARLDRAAAVVANIGRRLTVVETALAGGEMVTEAQAAEISLAVKALATALGGREAFGAVFTELYRSFNVSSYKAVPAARFAEVMAFLAAWHQRAEGKGAASDG